LALFGLGWRLGCGGLFKGIEGVGSKRCLGMFKRGSARCYVGFCVRGAVVVGWVVGWVVVGGYGGEGVGGGGRWGGLEELGTRGRE